MSELALALYLGLFAADAATSRVALARPHAREVLLTQSPLTNDLLIGSQAIGLYVATRSIERPRLRWTVRFLVAGVHGAAAIYNLRQLAK